MRNKFVIGIDGGTQSSKVVIFDLLGNVVCQGKKDLQPMHMTKTGIAEHPDDDLWDSIAAASREAMGRFTEDVRSIIGVGLCTIRCCRACLKEDGRLASPVLSWMDLRLARPYEHVDPRVKYVTATTGYITHRLTGEFKDTAANYEGMWPIDKETWQWSQDPNVIASFNVPLKNLFHLQMPGSILGYVTHEAAGQTGLPAGIPVAATANDKAVEALGAGLLPGNTALVSLGTYIGGMVYGEKHVVNAKTFFSNLASIPSDYLYESGGIRHGMGTVSWLRKLFGEDIHKKAQSLGVSSEELLNREAQSVAPGSDGLMTVPEWLAPPDKPFKKGIMIGFHGRHTRAHLYRSMLEAIALTMKNHVEAMCRELGLELDQIIVSGGGARSDLFMQIFADAFNLPAVRNEIPDAAGLGSAICAAVAVGTHDSFATAIEKMVRVSRRFRPIPEHAALYEKIYQGIYRHITGFTDPILEKSHLIFQQ
jgi:sugar (pentulose or hexulose) kinase